MSRMQQQVKSQVTKVWLERAAETADHGSFHQRAKKEKDHMLRRGLGQVLFQKLSEQERKQMFLSSVIYVDLHM